MYLTDSQYQTVKPLARELYELIHPYKNDGEKAIRKAYPDIVNKEKELNDTLKELTGNDKEYNLIGHLIGTLPIRQHLNMLISF